jgi:hypothetical protein
MASLLSVYGDPGKIDVWLWMCTWRRTQAAGTRNARHDMVLVRRGRDALAHFWRLLENTTPSPILIKFTSITEEINDAETLCLYGSCRSQPRFYGVKIADKGADKKQSVCQPVRTGSLLEPLPDMKNSSTIRVTQKVSLGLSLTT